MASISGSRTPVPEFRDKKIEVLILKVCDPITFMLKESPSLNMSKSVQAFIGMETEMQSYYNEVSRRLTKSPKLNELVVVKQPEDNKFYRAILNDIVNRNNKSRFRVYLVDYGKELEIGKENIHNIIQEFTTVSFQAFKFILKDLIPVGYEFDKCVNVIFGPTKSWDRCAEDMVKEFAKNYVKSQITIDDFDRDKTAFCGQLYITFEEVEIHLNKLLVENSFASVNPDNNSVPELQTPTHCNGSETEENLRNNSSELPELQSPICQLKSSASSFAQTISSDETRSCASPVISPVPLVNNVKLSIGRGIRIMNMKANGAILNKSPEVRCDISNESEAFENSRIYEKTQSVCDIEKMNPNSSKLDEMSCKSSLNSDFNHESNKYSEQSSETIQVSTLEQNKPVLNKSPKSPSSIEKTYILSQSSMSYIETLKNLYKKNSRFPEKTSSISSDSINNYVQRETLENHQNSPHSSSFSSSPKTPTPISPVSAYDTTALSEGGLFSNENRSVSNVLRYKEMLSRIKKSPEEKLSTHDNTKDDNHATFSPLSPQPSSFTSDTCGEALSCFKQKCESVSTPIKCNDDDLENYASSLMASIPQNLSDNEDEVEKENSAEEIEVIPSKTAQDYIDDAKKSMNNCAIWWSDMAHMLRVDR